jgi:hypothetical protein
MEEKEIIKNLKEKLKEIKTLRNLNSKDFKFKSWHISTLNLLRSFPPGIYSKNLNNFKKLSFTDTKYHRDKKDFNTTDLEKYNDNLNKAEDILKKITSIKAKDTEKVKDAKKSN